MNQELKSQSLSLGSWAAELGSLGWRAWVARSGLKSLGYKVWVANPELQSRGRGVWVAKPRSRSSKSGLQSLGCEVWAENHEWRSLGLKPCSFIIKKVATTFILLCRGKRKNNPVWLRSLYGALKWLWKCFEWRRLKSFPFDNLNYSKLGLLMRAGFKSCLSLYNFIQP